MCPHCLCPWTNLGCSGYWGLFPPGVKCPSANDVCSCISSPPVCLLCFGAYSNMGITAPVIYHKIMVICLKMKYQLIGFNHQLVPAFNLKLLSGWNKFTCRLLNELLLINVIENALTVRVCWVMGLEQEFEREYWFEIAACAKKLRW
jgi:hypothetical protein